jgi:redox-sensing transcriptional repressor
VSPVRRGRKTPPGGASLEVEFSPLTVNRLSLYLRALLHLREQGVARISSQDLAHRYRLNAALMRKDLAQFGEFGIRGVGYEVAPLAERIAGLLGLERAHALVICGVGNLGSALARYWGFNHGSFRVVAAVDTDPQKVGKRLGSFTVGHARDLKRLVRESGADIGVLAVPESAAAENFAELVAAGVRAVINFAPLRLEATAHVRVKNVDLRISLEEVAFFLSR